MLTLISPAKINLFLQVLGKRADGYHEIASLFQTISLYDTLRFSFSDQNESNPPALSCSDPGIPIDRSNLVMKAVKLFRQKTHLKKAVKIHLEKRIPKEAGLGGGSSNAATTLFALNQLFNEPLSLKELQNLASEIGSDVPFFLSLGTAYCRGRGELVTELAALQKKNLWVLKPTEGLKTALIFQELKPEEMSKKEPGLILDSFLKEKPDYFNDLEKPAFRVLPKLFEIKNRLKKAGFSNVLMSGSGSSFFCEGEGEIGLLDSFELVFKGEYLNREKNKWYLTEKELQ